MEDWTDYVYAIGITLVIGGHFVFAAIQVLHWPWLCSRLTKLTPEEAEKTRFLGRSIASYNASIGLALIMSFGLVENAWEKLWDYKLLDEGPNAMFDVHMVVMLFIAATAVIGALGTKGLTIWLGRFLPAVATLAALYCGVKDVAAG